MDTPERWILRNVARRPIEIHEAGDVRIIPPNGSIEVEAIGSHCAALIGRGLLTQQEAPPPADDEDSEGEAGAEAEAEAGAEAEVEGEAGAETAESASAKPRRRAGAKHGSSKKKSPQPGVAVVEEDPATGLRKGEGE